MNRRAIFSKFVNYTADQKTKISEKLVKLNHKISFHKVFCVIIRFQLFLKFYPYKWNKLTGQFQLATKWGKLLTITHIFGLVSFCCSKMAIIVLQIDSVRQCGIGAISTWIGDLILCYVQLVTISNVVFIGLLNPVDYLTLINQWFQLSRSKYNKFLKSLLE